jgi:hypothetical protein
MFRLQQELAPLQQDQQQQQQPPPQAQYHQHHININSGNSYSSSDNIIQHAQQQPAMLQPRRDIAVFAQQALGKPEQQVAQQIQQGAGYNMDVNTAAPNAALDAFPHEHYATGVRLDPLFANLPLHFSEPS